MKKLKEIWGNQWVKFYTFSLLYVLWFVVWAQLWWTIIGLVVIYDYYISQYYRKWFWNKHLSLKDKSSSYKNIAGWVEALIFAVVVASLVRIYFVEMYVIPTPSMERSLLVGDYLGVSKVSYGPKLPNTPLSIPFVHNLNPLNSQEKSYVEWIKRPYRRLVGFDTIDRMDVVVFNYPEGDTVALIDPQMNYYQLERSFGRENIKRQSKIISHPVDKRDNYVKRAIAIPGDKLQIIEGEAFVNGVIEQSLPGREYTYLVTTDGSTLPTALLEEMEVNTKTILYGRERGLYQMTLTDDNAKKLRQQKNVVSANRYIDRAISIDIFPHDTLHYKWSVDNFGPLVVPRKGSTVVLNKDNIALYRRIIKVYEGNTLEEQGDGIFINGQKTDRYTFRMNYFFMMGDNRHNSLDSRYWGFVPEDHVVGKASFVWFSVNKDKKFPANIRFKRMFRLIE